MMHLSLLPNPPLAEPYFHLLETRGETQTTTRMGDIPDAKQTKHAQMPPQDGGNISQQEDELKETSSSESSTEDGENEEDEMAALLRENSASGSSDEDDDITVPPLRPSGPSKQTARKKGLLNRWDSPTSNVAVLVVACWTMRIPVMCADFRKSVHSLGFSNLTADIVAGSSSCTKYRTWILFGCFPPA
jgi:RNA polymerase I-specific transcription initiation factor RRN7